MAEGTGLAANALDEHRLEQQLLLEHRHVLWRRLEPANSTLETRAHSCRDTQSTLLTFVCYEHLGTVGLRGVTYEGVWGEGVAYLAYHL